MLLVRIPVGAARAFAKRTREVVGAGPTHLPALRRSDGCRRTLCELPDAFRLTEADLRAASSR